MPSETIVSVRDVHFSYCAQEIISGISCDIAPGDYIGIAGPNGSGKTTLVKLILGLLTPSAGDIILFGTHRRLFSQWSSLGYLPQRISAYNPQFPATVREIVNLGLLARKPLPRRFDRADSRAVAEILSLLGIDKLQDSRIGRLSGGQLQRVLLARALVGAPQLLILDEPTLALDPEVREKFFITLKELNRDRGVTILLVTHDIGTIGRYASKLLYLDKRIIFFGGFDEFCSSADAGLYFGAFAQHIICHRHD
jgi:zinc transport system ATP-binding protein